MVGCPQACVAVRAILLSSLAGLSLAAGYHTSNEGGDAEKEVRGRRLVENVVHEEAILRSMGDNNSVS